MVGFLKRNAGFTVVTVIVCVVAIFLLKAQILPIAQTYHGTVANVTPGKPEIHNNRIIHQTAIVTFQKGDIPFQVEMEPDTKPCSIGQKMTYSSRYTGFSPLDFFTSGPNGLPIGHLISCKTK